MTEDFRDVLDFKLERKPLGVATKSGYENLNIVTLKSPIALNRKEASIIKNFVGATFKQLTSQTKPEDIESAKQALEENKSTEDDSLTGADLAMQASLLGVDDEKFTIALEAFRTLITAGECSEVGGVEMTKTLFDKLDFEDMENMFYQYAISFLLRSLLV